MVQRPHLEPIQEESEQEDEIEGSTTGEEEEEEEYEKEEEEEEDFQVGVKTKEVMTADESEEDEDDVLLRVLRPRRMYPSRSQVSFPRMRSTNKHQKEIDSSVSEQSAHSVDLNGEDALRPVQARLGKEKRSVSDELRIKISRIKWKIRQAYKVPVQKTTRKRQKKKFPSEPFPKWLVDLMFNIEEAKTHQLLVE
ncbi:hypothetical protein D9C73_014069 [Collichthys lucidus]|uniref:Uncharacterized protein n=1 Tax=Collichthys lucidus TaxID=240159 RepID=A0A4U5UY31_COLLU|nr:hypothetical protein D9C73_014069 [Collichthys lucidus]